MGYRKWVVLCSLAVLFLFQSNSNAIMSTGGSTGGGNVVSCTDPLTNIKTHRLLDYYEAETLMPELLPELGNGGTELEKVDFVLDRLEKHDPRRAKKYRVVAHEFFKNTQFIQNKVLPDINDHGYVPKEPHCIIEQLAVQNISPFPQAKKYVVREEFWKKLSLEDRAGLILHEVIYGEAMAMGQKTSRNSRYFNALMSSKKLETMSAAEYEDRLERVGFTENGSQPVVPPPWEMAATNFTAHPGRPFLVNLSDYIINGDRQTFSFSKMSGPVWLSVTPDGRLSGTPGTSDLGMLLATISVDDGKQIVVAKIQITVRDVQDDKLSMAIVGSPFQADLINWSPTAADIKSIKMASGPRWLSVRGSFLVGTPTASDVGVFTVQIDYTYTLYNHVEEHQPDGSSTIRVVPEELTERLALTGLVRERPPVGREVAPDEFEEVVFLNVSNAGCVATIVGPRVVMTAAHCAQGGSTGIFKFRGRDYSARFVRSPLYPKKDHDMALGLTSADIVGAQPLSIKGTARVGATLNLVTMALDRPSKRDTEIQVTGFSGFDALAQHATKQPVIYFGDSGAPAFGNQDNGIVGITSKMGGTGAGNGLGGVIYLARMDTPESLSFLNDFAKQNNADICGVTMTCP